MNPLLNKELRKLLTKFLGHKVGDVDIVKVSEGGVFSKLTLTVYPENVDRNYKITYQIINNPKNTDLSDQQEDQ